MATTQVEPLTGEKGKVYKKEDIDLPSDAQGKLAFVLHNVYTKEVGFSFGMILVCFSHDIYNKFTLAIIYVYIVRNKNIILIHILSLSH